MTDPNYAFSQDQLDSNSLGGRVSVIFNSDYPELYKKKVSVEIVQGEPPLEDDPENEVTAVISLRTPRVMFSRDALPQAITTAQFEFFPYLRSGQYVPFSVLYVGLKVDVNNPNLEFLLSENSLNLYLVVKISD